jgi:hypothetical protein
MALAPQKKANESTFCFHFRSFTCLEFPLRLYPRDGARAGSGAKTAEDENAKLKKREGAQVTENGELAIELVGELALFWRWRTKKAPGFAGQGLDN